MPPRHYATPLVVADAAAAAYFFADYATPRCQRLPPIRFFDYLRLLL